MRSLFVLTISFLAVTLTLLADGKQAKAQETVLYNFQRAGNEGTTPIGKLVFDTRGKLYGTTQVGGAGQLGTVFELSPIASGGWSETVLHTFFFGTADGYSPYAGVIFDSSGNLYGTTSAGGTYGAGTVFKLSPATGGSWNEKILHNFNSSNGDGAIPYSSLAIDSAGNVYGTTFEGGVYGKGTVFELIPSSSGEWTEKVLYSFKNDGKDAASPFAGVVFDAAGNLYGTTLYGGVNAVGAVFEMTVQPTGTWAEKVLHSFNIVGGDGYSPYSGVILDTGGEVYGTTNGGGDQGGAGIVFKLTHLHGDWIEEVLYGFGGQNSNGWFPNALALIPGGNLLGTTAGGGQYQGGTVFQLSPKSAGRWAEKTLHTFYALNTDGFSPNSLTLGVTGNLYGATGYGGAFGGGTVFELKF